VNPAPPREREKTVEKHAPRWRLNRKRVLAAGVVAITAFALQAGTHASAKPAAGPGCGEDSFLAGALSPSNSGAVTVPLGSSQTFSVVYHDESAINTNPGFAAQYSVTDASGHVVQSGGPAASPASAPAGTKDKFNTLLSVNWGPSAPGNYVLTIKAWDGDQNKAGGDCGEAAWAVTTPSPPTTQPPPTTTTVPKVTTTTAPGGTTTTTIEPSTPQTNVLGEQLVASPTAPAVIGTPALTG
jgi:hypothetical protein